MDAVDSGSVAGVRSRTEAGSRALQSPIPARRSAAARPRNPAARRCTWPLGDRVCRGLRRGASAGPQRWPQPGGRAWEPPRPRTSCRGSARGTPEARRHPTPSRRAHARPKRRRGRGFRGMHHSGKHEVRGRAIVQQAIEGPGHGRGHSEWASSNGTLARQAQSEIAHKSA